MRFFTTVYLFLLGYIIAALVFWGSSLHRQSVLVYEQDKAALREHIDSIQHPAQYSAALTYLTKKKDSRTKQYIGEGVTFLIVIMIGALVVYSSFRRSINLSRQQNNFMLSVTHELKSPIAAMKLNLQTLEKYQLTEEKRNQLLDRCIIESNRLNDLCNNMLIASQMEGHQYKQAKEVINFSQMVQQSATDYNHRYTGRFEANIQGAANVVGDKLLLQMAINNILENAVKYTPKDTEINITLERQDNKAILRVADQGQGIPDAEKKKIFLKFYRLGDENTRRTKGTGLGLYLTHIIIKQHAGAISIKNNKPNGAIFEILLPLT